MSTDVKLDQGDGSFLHLEARVVKAVGSDFMLDSPNRHKGGSPFRRALVHDQSDGLTVNFAGDYPGGIALIGVREIIPHQKTLVVHGDISYEIVGAELTPGGDLTAVKIAVSVSQEIARLQAQVAELVARVAALEAGL